MPRSYSDRQRDGKRARDLLPAAIARVGPWCGICSLGVDRTIKWPHDHYCVPDHTIPPGRGGKTVLENIKPAHWLCNHRKRDRLQSELPAELLEALRASVRSGQGEWDYKGVRGRLGSFTSAPRRRLKPKPGA
jgi:5-methylcytosine-specific restriction endonuclease McrA